MAARQDGWTDLVRLFAFSTAILVPVAGSLLYQGSILRSEIRDLRTEMRTEIGDLRETVGELEGSVAGLEGSVANLEVAVARIDARRSLRLMLALRFAASGEGANHGGPMIAAYLLLGRALPEFNNATLRALDMEAQSKLAEDLWEDRANILARANTNP